VNWNPDFPSCISSPPHQHTGSGEQATSNQQLVPASNEEKAKKKADKDAKNAAGSLASSIPSILIPPIPHTHFRLVLTLDHIQVRPLILLNPLQFRRFLRLSDSCYFSQCPIPHSPPRQPSHPDVIQQQLVNTTNEKRARKKAAKDAKNAAGSLASPTPSIPIHPIGHTQPPPNPYSPLFSLIHPLFILYPSSIHPLVILYASSIHPIHPLFILYSSSIHPLFILYSPLFTPLLFLASPLLPLPLSTAPTASLHCPSPVHLSTAPLHCSSPLLL
jgi:hypothetical protein